MKIIDSLLDKITMYKLVLYYLICLIGAAVVLCFFGVLVFNPLLLIGSTLFLVLVCLVTNKLFAVAFNAPTNVESVYISALILALILTPMKSLADIPLLFWAAVLTMASKYILAINKKHIFNPVAIAVVLTAFGFNGSASWWIGTLPMLPFTFLGILIVRKIRRTDLVFYFFVTAIITILGFSMTQGGNIMTTINQIISSCPIFFFAFIMLTEPLTTPPTHRLQEAYGMIVGVLFAPQFHIGSFYTTPEIALVLGNLFSYVVSPKYKLLTAIQQKLQIAPDMVDFLFPLQKKLAFSPGQYMEWTLPHKKPDSRGNRRYFTIASSPTEDTLRIGVRFYPNGSSFKKAMLQAVPTIPIVGAQVSGDFTLPKNKDQKLVFIAGGIGITPFRSMIKYLVDRREKRPITLLYSNKMVEHIVYYDIFNAAQQTLGINTVYTLTDVAKVPGDWRGSVGRIDARMIAQFVPDYKERLFYLSGPRSMITSYEDTLKRMGIKEKHIKKDYFPGFI